MKSESDSVLEILKQALYLEKQGKAFYTKVAEQAESEGLKNIFTSLAEEEDKHAAYLSEHFSRPNFKFMPL